ncbi:hypothetical protein [Aeromonas dhakensis]|nr:hypothetical protein [Aeromonas dhakensis]HDZ8830579.1 hypothetical protein [Aeromonas dhakensis]
MGKKFCDIHLFGAETQSVGQQGRVQIQFDEVGAKWLVTAYARLEAL